MSNLQKYKAPTIADLIADKEMAFAQDDLNMILNTPVPQQWIKQHPMVKANGNPLPYIPVKRVKWLLKRIYGKYEWEIKDCKQVLNAMVVIGRLTITNPVTGEKESQEGVGAAAIQMDKGATQGDLSSIKANAIQIGAPAAESYALKNAAEKFGDIFGGNIYDIDNTAYAPVFSEDVRKAEHATIDDIKELYDMKRNLLPATEIENIDRIIKNNETNSFKKAYKKLSAL